MNQAKVIMIGGYANSGKSTLIDRLENLFYVDVLSSSRLIRSKFIQDYGKNIDTKIAANREIFIDYVENKYLPSIGGRHQLVCEVLAQTVVFLAPFILIESIGGEEEELMEAELARRGVKISAKYNCRRTDEQPGVDLRQLLKNATDINCEQPWTGRQLLKLLLC
jgi:hypothetical protein